MQTLNYCGQNDASNNTRTDFGLRRIQNPERFYNSRADEREGCSDPNIGEHLRRTFQDAAHVAKLARHGRMPEHR